MENINSIFTVVKADYLKKAFIQSRKDLGIKSNKYSVSIKKDKEKLTFYLLIKLKQENIIFDFSDFSLFTDFVNVHDLNIEMNFNEKVVKIF